MKTEIIDNKYVSAKDWLVIKIDEIVSKIG